MRNLLNADFHRLLKNKIFYAILFLTAALAALFPIMETLETREAIQIEQSLFTYGMMVGCPLAVFTSMFCGTCYTDGTVRNPCIAGHSRYAMYFSHFVISVILTVISIAVWFMVYIAVGLLCGGVFMWPVGKILLYVLLTFLLGIASAAMYHCLAMLIPNKASSAVVCLLVFFTMLMGVTMINAKLDAPETVSFYSLTVDGVEMSEPEPNPAYVREPMRTVLQYALEIVPAGQGVLLVVGKVAHMVLMMIASILWTTVFCILGAVLFAHKDLK